MIDISEVLKSCPLSLQSINIEITEQSSFQFMEDGIKNKVSLKNIKMNVTIGGLLTIDRSWLWNVEKLWRLQS